MDGEIDRMILCHFQHYFSHNRPMEGGHERLCATEPGPFTIEKSPHRESISGPLYQRDST